jgi:uncharacterized membrane protein YphA (DoxX/SURF4 family)
MRKKVLTVFSILFGLMMINSGLNKFFNYIPVPDDLPAPVLEAMTAFMQIGWVLPLVAVVVEIAGGILFIIPRFRALGAIMILPVMAGILLFHLVQAPENILMALIFAGINAWAIAEDWRKYQALVRS